MLVTPAVPDPPEIQALLWEGFSSTDCAYDVGANCGQTIGHISKFSDFVVAFEPSEESFQYLLNRYQHLSDVLLCSLAVSDNDIAVDLVAVDGKIDTGQLVTDGTPGMEWSPDLGNGSVRKLPAVTLDKFAFESDKWPGFIKIDVEGHEWKVLQGAKRVLRTGPEMLIEVHSEELGQKIHGLLSSDFRIDVVRHPHYSPGSPLWKTHFWYKCFPPRSIY